MAQMRRGLNKVGSTWNVSRFYPALNWNRFLKDQRRGLPSLNSASVNIVFIKKIPLWSKTMLIRHCQGTNAVFVYYPRGLKALYFDNFDNFDNSLNIFLWPEYFIDYLYERWIPWQASTSVLCLHYRPETIHCSTKDARTSEITFLALLPCLYGSLHAAPGIPHGLRWLKLG